MKFEPQDLAALLVAVVATVGVVAIAALAKEVPPELTGLLGLAAGWLFRGQAEVTLTRKRGAP